MVLTPAGNEVLNFDPFALPGEYLQAIGLMSAAASSTDSIYEMAIGGVLGLDGEQMWAVTAHMPGPLRRSVLCSAAEIRFDDAKTLDELDTILSAIKKAVEDRNDMIHGSWCVRPSDKQVCFVQQEARTHVTAKLIPVTVDEIELKATALYDAGIALMQFLIDHDIVPALPRDRPRGVNTPKARKAARKKDG